MPMKNRPSFLFSYCLRHDNGSAPNPYWGHCTLVICKPVIRRVAQIDDWIVGTGSTSANGHDFSNHLIYAMRLSKVIPMLEYPDWAKRHAARKFPVKESSDYRMRLGDCIYERSDSGIVMREGVHDLEDMEHDMSGVNALISDHFLYFGREPIPIPPHLLPICHQTQGHKSRSNAPYFGNFEKWIERLPCEWNTPLNPPAMYQPVENGDGCGCARNNHETNVRRHGGCPRTL